MGERSRVYGEVAADYDDLRPGYPSGLADAVLAYAGAPGSVVEVGAGTGKATALFAPYGVPVHCIEPDRRMAAVLRERLAAYPHVTVEVAQFETWRPPAGGADLLYSAQAWHWVEPDVRWRHAHAALAPGGAVAIFAHSYDVRDAGAQSAIWQVHRSVGTTTSTLAPPGGVDPQTTWFAAELRDSGWFTDVRAEVFRRAVEYSTEEYVALVATFSAYRTLPPAGQDQMRAEVAQVIDERGGSIDVDLATVLALGRRG